MKPSRNDPCPCGSGSKYKHCCGALPAAAPPTQQEPQVAALAAMLKQGQLREAETQTHMLLRRYPDHGMLWKILSVALMQQGKDALAALRRAAELLPADAEAHRNLGAGLHDRGQLQEALSSLQRSLEIEPHLQVLLAVGNTLCALGRPGESVPLYERALHSNPRLFEAQNNLGNALQELGECARAVSCYRLAVAINPDDAEIHCNLSNALRRLGQLHEAIACSQRAIELAPGLSLAHNNLGLALAALGRGEAAVASFRRAVELNPRSVEALNSLANVLGELGKPEEALPLLRTAAGLSPQRADVHYYQGNTLHALGQVAESVVCFRRALALQPDYPLAHLALATALRLEGRPAEAESSCRTVLAAQPEHVAALCLLGDLHADRGEFTAAQRLFEQALALDGEFPPAFCSIAAHRRMRRDDTAWLQGAEALLSGSLPLQHEIGVRFALGKYHDDLREYDAAFSHYRQANELSKRHESPYDREQLTQHIDQIIASCDITRARAADRGASASEAPVFVIGMPRSGTSLTEQILASHPEAEGAGEIRFWDGAFAALATSGFGAGAGEGTCARLAREYLARLGTLSGSVPRVIDKMPANFLYAGLIHAVLPRARILHMQRHPLDTCLSIYFQNFFRLHPYACDLDDLVHFYREYVRITNHWRAVLPRTTLLEIPYEALIEDQEYWTRRMLDFIGLPWNPRCLDFHQTERVVITASRWHVRQRINGGSVGRWRNYDSYLDPLRPLLSLVGATAQRSAGA
jgi:tetratricopeptide (TPR) repeat protein